MGEFEKQIEDIFTGSVAYNKNREFIEACLKTIHFMLKSELLDALESASPYTLSRVKQVYMRWFGED